MSRRRTVAALSAGIAFATLLSPAPAVAAPEPAPDADYCAGQCHDVLPPGQSGNATLADLAGHMLLGTMPPHSDDQLDRYAGLAHGYRQLNTATINEFFTDNSFGVAPDDVARTYRPRRDVTVVRDKSRGVPHIYGSTRSGTTFGAGYSTAEDKLFLMDVLR